MEQCESNPQLIVPTAALLGYLVTVLSWELEGRILVLHAYTTKKLDPLGQTALLTIAGCMSCFAWFRGERDIKGWGGRLVAVCPITRSQGVIITLFMVVFGVSF